MYSSVILDIMEAMMFYGNMYFLIENDIVMNKSIKMHSLVQNKSNFEFNQNSFSLFSYYFHLVNLLDDDIIK